MPGHSGPPALPRSAGWEPASGERAAVQDGTAPGGTARGTTWSVSFHEPVRATRKGPALRARRPSARARPGRCGPGATRSVARAARCALAALGSHQSRLLLLQPQDCLRFAPEAAEFFRLVLAFCECGLVLL